MLTYLQIIAGQLVIVNVLLGCILGTLLRMARRP